MITTNITKQKNNDHGMTTSGSCKKLLLFFFFFYFFFWIKSDCDHYHNLGCGFFMHYVIMINNKNRCYADMLVITGVGGAEVFLSVYVCVSVCERERRGERQSDKDSET